MRFYFNNKKRKGKENRRGGIKASIQGYMEDGMESL
jgi:hypothetical protein